MSLFGVILVRVQSKFGKIRTRVTPNTNTFHAVQWACNCLGLERTVHLLTSWKVSKYGIVSGPYFLVFGLNTGKYGPEISSYLDTFHAVTHLLNPFSVENLSKKFSRIRSKENRSFNYWDPNDTAHVIFHNPSW